MKKILVIFGVLFLFLTLLILRPVPTVTEEKCEVISGKVSKVFEGGENDVVFTLAGVDRYFYVNRGLERGMGLRDLRQKLIGQKVTLKYPRYWTPLDPGNRIRHLAKIEFGKEVLYDETL